MVIGPKTSQQDQPAAPNQGEHTMTKVTRRIVVQGGLATAAVIAAPAIRRARAQPSPAHTVRAVFHGDIPTYDPIWTTANMSAYHGGMVYDTLLGIDGDQKP